MLNYSLRIFHPFRGYGRVPAPGRRGARLTARAVSAVLGWLALVSFAAPGQAQTHTTLVSNYASRHATNSLTFGNLTATDNLVQAQKFETGSRPAGYPLSSVKFYLANLDGENVSPRVSVYSRDSNGVPGSELYLLSGTVSVGKVTLTSPASAVLSANTEYFVHFEDTHTSETRGSYAIGLVDDADTDTALSGSAKRIAGSRRVSRGLGDPNLRMEIMASRAPHIGCTACPGSSRSAPTRPPTASDASVTTNKDSTVVRSTEPGLHRWHLRSRLVRRLHS